MMKIESEVLGGITKNPVIPAIALQITILWFQGIRDINDEIQSIKIYC